jgi:hypothetical protein
MEPSMSACPSIAEIQQGEGYVCFVLIFVARVFLRHETQILSAIGATIE